jgi:multidrug efflux pump
MLGIPPFTLLFMPLMLVSMFIHRAQAARRKRKMGNKYDERWTGSWF